MDGSLKFNRRVMGRDVVFVFGAGASYADGAPLQDEILPIILSGASDEIAQSDTGKAVLQFLQDNFAWDEQAGVYPTLESVFGFLDYFINQDEHLSARYPNEKIRVIKEGLIKIMHFVIGAKSNPRARLYRYFWETLARHNLNVSILTLNYDTLLEEAFRLVYPENYHIDYGIHLMNDDPGVDMDRGYLREQPGAGNGDAAGCVFAAPVAMKIMKAHGSLNWKYCHCCNQVLFTPWDTKIRLSGREARHNCERPAASGPARHCCPVDGSELETLIIPPSHVKRISHPVISLILNDSLREVRACKKVVFAGYSFPDADVHFKALFRKGLTGDQEIYVVNRTIKDKLKINYNALAGEVNFIESSFEDFIKGGFLEERVLQ